MTEPPPSYRQNKRPPAPCRTPLDGNSSSTTCATQSLNLTCPPAWKNYERRGRRRRKEEKKKKKNKKKRKNKRKKKKKKKKRRSSKAPFSFLFHSLKFAHAQSCSLSDSCPAILPPTFRSLTLITLHYSILKTQRLVHSCCVSCRTLVSSI